MEIKDIKNREDLINLRKEMRHNPVIANLLTVLVGECDRVSQNINREQINTVAKSMVKNNTLAISELGEGEAKEVLRIETEFLNQFLPTMLTSEELGISILEIIDSGKNNIGLVMKELNTLYPGQFDRKLASQLINEIIRK